MSEPAPPDAGFDPPPLDAPPVPLAPAGSAAPAPAAAQTTASSESGFTLRAVAFGFLMLMAWIFVINSSFPDSAYRLQQLIMLMGFGALLTLFFVKFLLGLLPAQLRLRPPETAVFFTILLIGIPSAMLGRLALESAAVNHLFEIGDNRSGQLGFVPANWAPEAHVRLPEHRNMVAPLSADEIAALPTRAVSVTRARAAATHAEAVYDQVLLSYVFHQKPDLNDAWIDFQRRLDAPARETLGAEFSAEEAQALAGRDAISEGVLWLLLTRNLNRAKLAADGPEWRRAAAEFKRSFDQASAPALEIFKPLHDVVDDADRFAQYAHESDRCPLALAAAKAAAPVPAPVPPVPLVPPGPPGPAVPPDKPAAPVAPSAAQLEVARTEAGRAALAAESCAASLATASSDIGVRLDELAANYAAIQGLFTGEGHHNTYAVPWKLWLVPMAYWAAVMLAFHGLAFAFLLAMRKVWVEAERLPFPYTILPERLERGVPPGPGVPEKQSLFPRWWMFIPFLVGLGLCLPHFLDISQHSINPPPPNPTDNMKDLSVAGWDIKLNMDTWTLALLLLFPLDLIFTALFFFFVGAYAIPYLVKLCGVEGFSQGLLPYQMLRMGGFLGLFVGTVWFNRRTMWQLVTGRRAPPRPGEATDTLSRDPLAPPVVTALFWISLVLLFGLLLYGETGGGATRVLLLLFGLFVVVVYNFQEWRIRAEGGFVAWDFNNIMKVQSWSNWYVFGLYHTSPDPTTQLPLPQSQLGWQQIYTTGLLGTYVPTLGPGAYFLEAFRIGDLFRASPRAILKAALLAFGFALVAGMPIYLACTYHYGLHNESMGNIWANFGHSSDKIFRYYMKRSDGGPFGTASKELSGFAYLYDILLGTNWRQSFLWTVAGAVCVIVLMYYRRNRARFPFNPVGFVIAGTGSSGTQMDMNNIWFAFLVAFLIKWLIHDWFGVRVFRTKVEPAITYLILGLCTGMLVYIVLVVLRLHYGVTWLEHNG